MSFPKDVNGEVKQVDKRFRTRCSTAEGLKGCACRSYSRYVPLWKLTRIEQANKFSVCFSPANFRIGDVYNGIGVMKFLRNFW